jgi:hypothetical protein
MTLPGYSVPFAFSARRFHAVSGCFFRRTPALGSYAACRPRALRFTDPGVAR